MADPFVGRAGELRQLRDALSLATEGEPQVVIVTGDAGIGKSRLLHELIPHATASGVEMLTGTCQEDVGVPYLPIATALAAPSRAEPVDPFAAYARDAELRAAADPGSTRAQGDAHLRLFLAAGDILLAAAKARPTMLVIEDVHWIDDASLGLLRHLFAVIGEEAAVARARLLVIVTSRVPDAASAAGAFVERLVRQPGAVRIALNPLDEHECRELVAAWIGREPSATTVDQLMEATAGQPLVLRSVLARLGDVDAIGDSALANLLGPTDLDHELWHRVDALGTEAREVVLNAAFLGDGASRTTLAAVCDLASGPLDDLVDEAARQRVLAADDDCCWFVHPQLRQLVYHWPTGRDRAARHLFIADRLEAAGADVMVVAHHLARAPELVDRARLVDRCGQAADRSAAIGAWREAARYASTALRGSTELTLADADVAALHFRAGYTVLAAGDRDTGVRHLRAAAEIARECDAIAIWGRALVHLGRLGVLTTDLRMANTATLRELDEFLATAGGREPAIRAEVHAFECELFAGMNELAPARRHAIEAQELASEINDDELRVKVGFATGLQQLGASEFEAADDQFESVCASAARLVDITPLAWCLTRGGLLGYLRGRLAATDATIADALSAARTAENNAEYSLAAAIAASVAAVRGYDELTELYGGRAQRAYRRSEFVFTPRILFPTLAAARAVRGDEGAAHEALDRLAALHPRSDLRYRPLVDALAGDIEAATATLDASTFRLFTGEPRPDYLLSGAIAAQVELGALTGRPALVRGPIATLVELYERGMRFTTGWPAFVPRVIALGMAAVDDPDGADEWFTRAQADAERAGALAERGRVALDHANVLAPRSNSDAGQVEELLEQARAAFDEAGLRPRLPGSDRLRGHTALLDARPSPLAVTRVVLVTDIAASTALNYRVGDPAYVRIVEEHNHIVRRRLAHHDAKEFKTTGDGVGAWFYSVHRALQCATELRDDFQALATQLGDGAAVKIALTAGEPTPVGTDLLGIDVTLAFRAVGLCAPGEVVVTASVVALADGRAWTFEPRGGHMVKGIDEAVELYTVGTG